jgi:hypothetical protein
MMCRVDDSNRPLIAGAQPDSLLRLRGKGLHALAAARAAISTSDFRLMCPSAIGSSAQAFN